MLVFLFLLSFQATAKIKISILDTGFCLEKVSINHSNIKINRPIDLTNSVQKEECKERDINLDRRYHGQLVLNTFLENIKTNEDIEITPYIIFDIKKNQKEIYWREAFSKQVQDQTDIYLVAAGLPYLVKSNLDDLKINTKVFVASGISGGKISLKHKLWPQSLKQQNPNLFIIGDHYPRTKYDTEYLNPKILNLKQIDYFFDYKGKNPEFSGSSYSVSLALAKALSICNEMTKLRECLSTNKKEIKWREKIKAYTF